MEIDTHTMIHVFGLDYDGITDLAIWEDSIVDTNTILIHLGHIKLLCSGHMVAGAFHVEGYEEVPVVAIAN